MDRTRLSATLVLLLFSLLNQCLYGQISDSGQTITSGDLVLSFDQDGAIVRLVDADSGTDYGVEKDHASLVGLISGSGQILSPDRFTFEDGLYRYRFAEGISVEVKADVMSDYITFEVVDFQDNTQREIAALFWRVDSRLRSTVAETAGIISDDSFALGIQGLNTKTPGGWFDDFDPPSEISKWHPGERTPFERSAIPTNFGSQLRAYTGDFTRLWVRRVGKIEAVEIPPLPREDVGDDGEIEGSRIAIYGCHTSRILEVLEKIVLAEDLPYPTYDGAWFRSPEGRQLALLPYYDVGRFDPNQAADTRYLTRRMGARFIYGDGAFANFQGDFRFKGFENSYADFKKLITDPAAREGLLTGAHSRSVEIDPRLPVVQGAENIRTNSHVFKRVPLLKPITKDQTGPLPIEPGSLTPLARRVMIDDEVIMLVKDRKAETDINQIDRRGAQGTPATAHDAGAMVSLLSTQNDQFYASLNYAFHSMLPQFTSLCNEHGLGGIGWDGNLSCFPLGYGSYLVDELEDRYYRSLTNRDNMYYSGAQITPYIWHFTTHRGGAGSMQPPGKQDDYTKECLRGFDYFARNFMISMMGTKFDSNTTLMHANWTCSKMAAWNTGIRVVGLNDNPNKLLIADIIREWAVARDVNAFTDEQRRKMAVHDTWWKLVPVEPGIQWRLEQYRVDGGVETLLHSEPAIAPGVTNLADNATISGSCPIDHDSQLNDGFLESDAIATLQMDGAQYVQLDCGKAQVIDQVRVWHFYDDGRRYRDVIIQLSNDPAFKNDVTTVFNNDLDNSTGQGQGQDSEYSEPFCGKTFKCSSVTARYVRLWSNGSDVDEHNQYAEIQVLSGSRTIPEYLASDDDDDVPGKDNEKKDKPKKKKRSDGEEPKKKRK